MRSSGFAALGLSLVTATAAYAQTTVTREVSQMPVETTITRSPTETVVTRRVLGAPVATEQVVTQSTIPAVTRTVTTTVRSGAPTARHSALPSRRSRRAMAMASEAELRAAPRQTVTRTITTREPAPLVLSAGERSVIYRTIADQDLAPPAPVSPPAAVFPPPPVTTQIVSDVPAFPRPIVSVPATTLPASTTVVQRSYLVGTRLPAGIELIALPDTVVSQMPDIAPYAYATLNGHVLLVDPHTGTIVADLAG